MPYALVMALSSGVAMAVLIAVGLGLALVVKARLEKMRHDRFIKKYEASEEAYVRAAEAWDDSMEPGNWSGNTHAPEPYEFNPPPSKESD